MGEFGQRFGHLAKGLVTTLYRLKAGLYAMCQRLYTDELVTDTTAIGTGLIMTIAIY